MLVTAIATLDAAAEGRVMAALATVPDPEIPVVSVVDLGIVRGVRADPFAELPIETVLSPAWSTDWISERGRAQLKSYGIAPPPRDSASRSLRAPDRVECP